MVRSERRRGLANKEKRSVLADPLPRIIVGVREQVNARTLRPDLQLHRGWIGNILPRCKRSVDDRQQVCAARAFARQHRPSLVHRHAPSGSLGVGFGRQRSDRGVARDAPCRTAMIERRTSATAAWTSGESGELSPAGSSASVDCGSGRTVRRAPRSSTRSSLETSKNRNTNVRLRDAMAVGR